MCILHALCCACTGITRGIVIQLCAREGIPCTEKRISLTECYTADEVFTTGTMGEITPVNRIDGRVIRNFIPGEELPLWDNKRQLTTHLQDLYHAYIVNSGVIIPYPDAVPNSAADDGL